MSKKITLAEIQAITTHAVTNTVLEDVYKDIDKKITEAAQKGHHEAKYHIPYDYMEYLSVILKEYQEFGATHRFYEADGIYPSSNFINFKW